MATSPTKIVTVCKGVGGSRVKLEGVESVRLDCNIRGCIDLMKILNQQIIGVLKDEFFLHTCR